MSAAHTMPMGSDAVSPARSTSTVWAQATSRGVWLHAERSRNSKIPAQVSVLLTPDDAEALAAFLTEHGGPR